LKSTLSDTSLVVLLAFRDHHLDKSTSILYPKAMFVFVCKVVFL
jgi:hypothetical protein